MDEFDARLREALDQLADGFIDRGIDSWETIFKEAEPYLSITQALWTKAEYAQALHDAQALEAARAVDRDIQEALERDEDEICWDVSEDDRTELFQNIINRWGISVDDDSTMRQQSNQRHDTEETSPPNLQQNEAFEYPRKNRLSRKRTQSFSVLGKHAAVMDGSIEEKGASMSLAKSAKGDVLFPGHQGTFRPVLQAFNLTSSESGSEQWYSQLEGKTHNFMYGKNSKFFERKADGMPYATVKIAVLDTGIAYSKPEHKKVMKKYWDRVPAYSSYISGEVAVDALNDESGHGTAVAVQLMKTCPTAQIYVCRVAKGSGNKSIIEEKAVERAIYEAIDKKKWGVDIINMSFGWDYNSYPDVSKAIAIAKAQGVLLFASTSNYGVIAPNDILYPALADEVISVDAADGNGEPAKFNPSSVLEHGKERFTAPGIGISSPISQELLHGTSFASPIAAGAAALVLEFARQSPLADSPSVSKWLHERRGMVLIFRAMSKQKGVDPFKFLCPWELLGDEWGVYRGDGQPGTKRYFVAYEIVQRLRKGFGKSVGQEIFPTT